MEIIRTIQYDVREDVANLGIITAKIQIYDHSNIVINDPNPNASANGP